MFIYRILKEFIVLILEISYKKNIIFYTPLKAVSSDPQNKSRNRPYFKETVSWDGSAVVDLMSKSSPR